MKMYLAIYERHSEEYVYSLHRSEASAEAAARAMLEEDIHIDANDTNSNGDLVADLDFEGLQEWLDEENGHSVDVRELTLED